MGLFSDDGSYNEHTYIWKFYHLIGKAAEKNGISMAFCGSGSE